MNSAVITEPSICIPRTLNNRPWYEVKNVFESLIGKGTVERVDIVRSKNTNDYQPFCRIFVHFRYWPNTPEIMSIRQRLIDGQTIKVVYDTPWFWKCSASRVPKPEHNAPRQPPHIEFTETTTNDATPVTTPEMVALLEEGVARGLIEAVPPGDEGKVEEIECSDS